MTAARLIVTAETPDWARTAGRTATGYAASVIGCDAEAGVENELSPAETPDGRPGISLLFFAFSRDALQKALVKRVGQCILTCATSACYNGLPLVKDKTIRIGGNLRFFGDGFQFSKKLEGRRFWRLPVMDGEFTCEDRFGTTKGVAGGNFLIVGDRQESALAAAEAAVAAVRRVPGVILPSPPGPGRPQRQQGQQPIQEAAGQHQRRLLPDPARPGEVRPARGGERGLRDRHRRPRPAGGGGGDPRRRPRRLPARRAGHHRGQL